jgi:hypothetical protein
VPSKDGHEGNPIPVGIGFLGIQYTNHGLAWDRLGHGITKVVSEAPAVGCSVGVSTIPYDYMICCLLTVVDAKGALSNSS